MCYKTKVEKQETLSILQIKPVYSCGNTALPCHCWLQGSRRANACAHEYTAMSSAQSVRSRARNDLSINQKEK